MRRFLVQTVWIASALICHASASLSAQSLPTPIATLLTTHRYDLAKDGRSFLLAQAKQNDYFLLGELHGENEIPELIHTLWPEMWKDGYRHIAAEISPWTALQLQTVPPGTESSGTEPRIDGLWTRRQARDVNGFAEPDANVVWGCDMEEVHPEYLVRELAGRNPGSASLRQMVELTHDGYKRAFAPQLLTLLDAATQSGPWNDRSVQGISLSSSLRSTLEIEVNRSSPETRMQAQNQREQLMKQQLAAHLRAPSRDATGKLMLRFGRNHLHRGYDARGVSTLGNFVAEYAILNQQHTFNVGAFAAGGKARLLGNTFDASELADEPAFALLAGEAPFPATVYDLRPLRSALHSIPFTRRTPLETNLLYWADSYDALICYRSVTPLQDSEYQ